MLSELRRLGWRNSFLQVLQFCNVVCTALMMWKFFGLCFNTESPIVVVLSGSMEPAFQRGDLLFLSMPQSQRLQVGDITVYNVPGAAVPIVHRVIEAHDQKPDIVPESTSATLVEPDSERPREQWLLTKGDNNLSDDVSLYNGVKYLKRSNIIGKVTGYVPYLGYSTIIMNDYPKIKYVILGVLGLSVLIQRE